MISRPGISFSLFYYNKKAKQKTIDSLFKATTSTKKCMLTPPALWIYDNCYYLLYIRESITSFSYSVTNNNKWASNVIHRGGIYRTQLYLSLF